MEPLWISLQNASLATTLAALAAFLAARIRFSLSRASRTVLDILFLLPLALSPYTLVNAACRFWSHSPSIVFVIDNIAALPIFYLCAWMGFRNVDPETMDAARIQGLGHCGIFWRVWFPAAWPWLVSGFALGLLRYAIALAIAYT